jgi:hypothetical protein
MDLTLDLLSTPEAIATLGVMAAEELKKDGYILFYSDEQGSVRASNAYVLNLFEMDEVVAIKVLNAAGKSRDEIIEFVKERQSAQTEREKTNSSEDPSEHS